MAEKRADEFDTPVRCPFCSRENEASYEPLPGIEPVRAPVDGDFSMCFTCGEWAVYEAAAPGGQRKPLFNEYMMIVNDPKTSLMRHAWLRVMEEKKRDDT